MKHAKEYVEAAKKILPDTLHPVDDASKLVRKTSVTKFDATIEVAMRLNIDPHKADQLVHGTVNLSHGTGEAMRVLVLAVGEEAVDARAAGADEADGGELIEKVSRGYTDLDVTVATPDLMGGVDRLGRMLDPCGLVPNPKTGTMTMDMAKAVKDIKGGRTEFHVDKHTNLQFVVGKVSFDAGKLAESYHAVFEEVMRLRPSTVKGRYITKATVSTIMGPSVPLALAEEKEV